MDANAAPTEVDFHFDVMCPWAYQTSLWMRDVRDQLGLTVNWKFFSLEEINLREGKKHPWERDWSYGWSMMRIGVILRRLDMNLLDQWYAVAGKALHVDGNLKIVGNDPRIKIDGDVDSHPGLEFYENGTRKWIIFNNYGDDSLDFKTNSNTRMVINQDGTVGIGTQSPASELHINGALTLTEKSSDPSNPSEGQSVLWMSDGTGTGDDGDILMKITAGGVTKTVTLVDFSAS